MTDFLDIAICRNCKFFQNGMCLERNKEVTIESSCASFTESESFELLKNPNLFNEITEKEFDKKICGEVESRKVIFLCANGRLIENSQIASYNLLVNDEAGTGKDFVTNGVLSIFPKEICIHKTRISPAVFTYWHNSKFEPDWTWNSKIFYPEDISEQVLNSDVFKVMCSRGSSATIVIKQVAHEIEIIGKPVMITTTATATPSPELVRRFVILNLDGSESQTKAIMKRQSDYAKKGIIPEYNQEYTEALSKLKRIKVKVPFADLIDRFFPEKNIIMRTNYPRFLDFIKASVGFHQFQRKQDESGFYLAEKQDYEIAKDCFLRLCSNRYMIPLTINQKKILAVFDSEKYLRGSVSQLHSSKLSFMALKNLQDNLQKLVTYGLLETETDKDTYGRDLEIFILSKSYNPNEKMTLPNWEELQNEVSKVNKVNEVSKVNKVNNLIDVYDVYDVYPQKDIINSKIPQELQGEDTI